MDGLDQAFSGEGVAVEDVEGSGVEGQAAAIGDPKGATNFSRVLVPDRDLFRIDARLQNRHQRGLVLADGDLLLEVVLEIVAEVFTFGFRLLSGGCPSRSWREFSSGSGRSGSDKSGAFGETNMFRVFGDRFT